MHDPSKFGRKELRNYMLKYQKLHITEVVAIEGILFCRGQKLEESMSYSRERLVEWLTVKLPGLL